MISSTFATLPLQTAISASNLGPTSHHLRLLSLSFLPSSSRPTPCSAALWSVDRSSRCDRMDWIQSMSGGCFKDPAGKHLKVEADSGGEVFFDAASNSQPEHLVIMVNGLIGSAADWRFAAEQFVKKLPDKVIVHRSECNYSKLTFDGVDLMGERLAEEILAVARHRPDVQKISFVAHSLGGLVARYAIGRLFESSQELDPIGLPKNSLSEKRTSFSMQCLEQPFEGRIAGLQPMNFITFATPHLGSKGNKQLPLLCGLPFLERRASQTAHLIAGRSGKHLFLTDNDDGKPPLLLEWLMILMI
ncbi:hypothetical protein LWI29_000839 [Acer saccharum]|uniref:DUF676 domain-containing protein n=1 Tax=Acer saccharum TaxID=4024 RepID=A0AA39RB42_ACESA|nr:hypothetical protein LWI29_000839 [Acer saccharum]